MLTMQLSMYGIDRGRGDRSESSVGCYLLPSSNRFVFFFSKCSVKLLMHMKYDIKMNHLRMKAPTLFHIIQCSFQLTWIFVIGTVSWEQISGKIRESKNKNVKNSCLLIDFPSFHSSLSLHWTCISLQIHQPYMIHTSALAFYNERDLNWYSKFKFNILKYRFNRNDVFFKFLLNF